MSTEGQRAGSQYHSRQLGIQSLNYRQTEDGQTASDIRKKKSKIRTLKQIPHQANMRCMPQTLVVLTAHDTETLWCLVHGWL